MHLFFILIPFLLLILINLLFNKITKGLSFWLAAFLLLAEIVFSLVSGFNQGKVFSAAVLGSIFKFNLLVDQITNVMFLSIGIVLLAALFINRSLIKDEDKRFNFINLLLITMAGLNGIVLASDIFSLYVFIEVSAVASFILIVQDKEILAFEGAFKYIILSAVATTFLIAGIAVLLLLYGHTDFVGLKQAIACGNHGHILMAATGLFLCGIFIKSGLMPFHGWVADAYSAAPAHVSVLLAGIITKISGVYGLIRVVVSVFGFNNAIEHVLLLVGAVSIVCAAVLALGQTDIKRMLAYSSISQVGYIILGLASGTALGVAAAVFHLFNHSIFKSLLFVNSAAVESQTGSRDLSKMRGLSQKMPLTSITSVLGSFSCAGIPPLAGFWSKLIIVIALLISGHYIFAAIAILSGILTLAYFLFLQRNLFFAQPEIDISGIKEGDFWLSFTAVMLAVIIVAAGIFFPLVLTNFILPLRLVLGG